MSEIRYTPNDEPTLGNVIRRQWKTQADFTYSILGNVISIIDLDPGEPISNKRYRKRAAEDRVLSSRFDSRLQDHVSGFRVHLGRGRLGRSTGFLFRVARNRRRTSAEEAFRAQMSMREPAEYGNDEVPIPVFYVLEIYQDTFRHEKPVVEIHTAEPLSPISVG